MQKQRQIDFLMSVLYQGSYSSSQQQFTRDEASCQNQKTLREHARETFYDNAARKY